jgi:hypothetical protein
MHVIFFVDLNSPWININPLKIQLLFCDMFLHAGDWLAQMGGNVTMNFRETVACICGLDLCNSEYGHMADCCDPPESIKYREFLN